jgi:hypothetical protein
MTMRLALKTVIAATFILAPIASAQSAAADEKALAEYRLSMPTIHKLLAATRNMAKLYQDPAVKAAADKLDKSKRSSEGYRGLAEMTRDIESFPPMANAIRSAGLTPREFMLANMAFMQAGMVVGFKKQGLLKEIPKGTPVENVAFLEKNDAELQTIMKEFGELQKQMKSAESRENENAIADEEEEPEPEPEQKPEAPKAKRKR